MSSICIYLQVHQPYRIKRYQNHHVGKDHDYFNSLEERLDNKKIFEKVCKKSYLPTNKVLLKILKKNKNFKLSISFSGTVLEQMEKFYPEALKSFQDVYNSGRVEILSETYYHSLAFFYSKKEFENQVNMHRRKVKKLFGVTPSIFRNTELSYNNDLAIWAEKAGYKGILTEGWEGYLKKRSPNFLYHPKGTKNIKLLLKNYSLSDDIAFRFSCRDWHGWPLSAKKFAKCIAKQKGETINLFLDYETFGEHQWEETGIFNFLESLPDEIVKSGNNFKTATETATDLLSQGEINVPKVLTWADSERDLSAWVGTKKQKQAIKSLYDLENEIIKSSNKKILNDWRKLQTSDHFYYMSTKKFDDGGVHDYFNPFEGPKEASLSYMNILEDLKNRVKNFKTEKETILQSNPEYLSRRLGSVNL